jgi:hypothetical protein
VSRWPKEIAGAVFFDIASAFSSRPQCAPGSSWWAQDEDFTGRCGGVRSFFEKKT